MRNFFETFLRARRALEFSHSQGPSLPIQDVGYSVAIGDKADFENAILSP